MLLCLYILPVLSWDYSLHGYDWEGTCKSGAFQSPINILPALTQNISSNSSSYFFFSLNYTPSRILNTNSTPPLFGLSYNPGFSFEIMADFGSLIQKTSPAKSFTCRHIMFHSPAEHLIDGVQYPLELQIVNKANNDIVILVILFKQSRFENRMLDQVIQAFGSAIGGLVELNDAIDGWFAVKDFYYYEGSFTRPECDGRVQYVVYQRVMTATKTQLQFFSSILQGNYRKTMPINSRVVRSFVGLEDAVNEARRIFAGLAIVVLVM